MGMCLRTQASVREYIAASSPFQMSHYDFLRHWLGEHIRRLVLAAFFANNNSNVSWIQCSAVS